MLTALIALAAATPGQASSPSQEFVRACYERAKSQVELDFCAAGEVEAKKHRVEDAEAVICFGKELTQMGMNSCAEQEFERADKALNLAWTNAKGWVKDDPQASALLLESQRAWLKYRDAQCAFIADENRGGSIVPLEHSKCLSNLTKERTEALTNFAKPLDEQ